MARWVFDKTVFRSDVADRNKMSVQTYSEYQKSEFKTNPIIEISKIMPGIFWSRFDAPDYATGRQPGIQFLLRQWMADRRCGGCLL